MFGYLPDNALINNSVYLSCVVAVPLALIIFSDCLCLKWLDRTHKITNPIKLILQVLNYTRKHRYPERRSAFTYLDEEHPSRMDFGKEKFGGPFTEEEVEDVKTVLKLLPLVICLSLTVSGSLTPVDLLTANNVNSSLTDMLLTYGSNTTWLFTVALIPLYQFVIHPLIHSRKPSMLKCIGMALFFQLLGDVLLEAISVKSVLDSGDHDVQRYISCKTLPHNAPHPGDNIDWYWKLVPFIFSVSEGQ